ncbi:MAG: acylneuraminate cytidylyltransferase family protein [Halothiobacillaceae bacterium]|nr:acylneuraminate cytidylyltransferase family protein [Halothiobacillaceae bacterium]
MSGPRVLALILARAGSKGLPGKNIRPLAGKPLIAWSIEQAQAARGVDEVLVSSDGEDILAIAREWGASTLRRPQALASDEARSIDAILHVLEQRSSVEYLILLQPTSPLREVGDIETALQRCLTGAPSCVGVRAVEESPWWMYTVDAQNRMQPLIPASGRPQRRQDLPPVYLLNGAVYVAQVDVLRRWQGFLGEGAVAHVMPAERSVDIDTAEDFQHAEHLINQMHIAGLRNISYPS